MPIYFVTLFKEGGDTIKEVRGGGRLPWAHALEPR
jgi:hypothetical protein